MQMRRSVVKKFCDRMMGIDSEICICGARMTVDDAITDPDVEATSPSLRLVRGDLTKKIGRKGFKVEW